MKQKNKRDKRLSARAGLVFPVQHAHRTLRDGQRAQSVANEAAVFLTGVLEYLVSEILTLAGQTALLEESDKITLHHLPGLQNRRTCLGLLKLYKEEEDEEEEEEEEKEEMDNGLET